MSKLLRITDLGVMPQESIDVNLHYIEVESPKLERFGMSQELIELFWDYADALNALEKA